MKNWKNLGRRGLSLLVCLMMCLSMLPGTALAAWGDSCTKGGKHAYELFNGKTPQGSVVAYTYCTKCYAIVDALGNWGEPGQYCSSYADHRYTYTPNGDANCQSKGTKTGTCDCGATIIVAGDSYGSHSYVYKDNGNGTHTGVCSNNSDHTTTPEACTYGSDGKCITCGAEQEKPCEHTNTKCEATGADHHNVVCLDCNETIHENVECTFTTSEAASCEDKQVPVNCASGCGNTSTLTIKGTGHSYGNPTWTWAADHSSATAKFDCTSAGCNHSMDVTATITKNGAPTCGESATITYTATVTFDDKPYTDSVTETVGATGEHSWSKEWSSNGTNHWYECTICHTTMGTSIGAHSNWTNGKCGTCGYECKHPNTEVRNAAEATCTAEGYTGDTYCTTCGVMTKAGETISKKSHNLTAISEVPATCEKTGTKKHQECSECKGLFVGGTTPTQVDKSALIIPALDHDWSDWKDSGTGTGGHTRTCKRAGCEKSETLPHHYNATWRPVEGKPHTEASECRDCGRETTRYTGNHTYVGKVTTYPTCITPGVMTYTCTEPGCNASYTEETATGSHAWDKVITPATCTAYGYEKVVCKVCGEVLKSVTLNKLAHNYTDEVTKETSCIEKGVRTYTCSMCKDSYTEDIPMVPHTLTEHEEVPATCTATGTKAHSHCSVCNKTFTGSGTGLTEVSEADLVIPMTDHTPVTDPAVEPTCTSTGLTEGSHCSVCGTVLVAQETIAMLSHTEVIDEAVAPTCTSTGLTAGSHCSVCGTTIVARTEIAANGHTEAIDAAVAPTCEETGLTAGSHCTVCDAVLTAQETIPALGHSWDDGVVTRRPTPTVAGEMTYTCTVCGATRTEPIPATNIELPEPDPDTDGGGTGGGAGGGTTPTPNPGGNVVIDDDDVPLADIIFDDVLPTDPFYEAVKYVYERGLMNGVSDTSFDPHGTLNRAMVVTILYRLEGEPTAEPSSFKDVEAGKWYTDAIGWGAANEIVEGYDADRFGPMDPVTREQLAAILYRYAQYKEYDVTAKADLTSYADASSIHEYAVEAMSWAVELGAPAPLDDGTLAPRVNATRAQVAVAFMNFCEKYVPLPAEGEAA